MRRLMCILLSLLFVLGSVGEAKIFAEEKNRMEAESELAGDGGRLEARAKTEETDSDGIKTAREGNGIALGAGAEKTGTGFGSETEKIGIGAESSVLDKAEKTEGGTESAAELEAEKMENRTGAAVQPETEKMENRTGAAVQPEAEKTESRAEDAAGTEEKNSKPEIGQADEKEADLEAAGAQEMDPAEASYLEELAEPQKTMQVLIVGNSFSRRSSGGKAYGVGKTLEELAAGEGKNLKVTTLAHGKAKFRFYAGMDTRHLFYYRELLTHLLSRDWDYIIFQECSTAPLAYFESATYPALQRLLQLVRLYQPKATPLLYMTPGYSNGKRVKIDGIPRRLTTREFQMYLAAAYQKLEDKTGVEAVPVGMHVMRANILYPRIQTVGPDLKHPAYAGYYLAACAFYQRIYGNAPDPRKAALTGCDLTDRQLCLLAGLTRDSMRVSRKELVLAVGQTARLSAVYNSHISKVLTVSYKSLNPKVAAVNTATGLVTAKGGGNTAIMAATSDGLQAFCNITVACEAPDGLEAVPKGKSGGSTQDGKIKVSWKAVSGAKTYDVYRSDYAGWGYQRIGSSRKNSYLDKAVSSNKVYYYKIAAKNANADCTSPLSASIRCILLKAPKLKASRDSQQHVKLAWKRNAKATGYVVYRSDRKKGGYHKIAKLANGREGYIDRTAQKGQTYYYKVKAFKRWGSRVCYGMQSERIMVKVLSNK